MRGIVPMSGLRALWAAAAAAAVILPTQAAPAPGAKVSQVDLTLQDQPPGQESRRAIVASQLAMDRLGNVYRFESLSFPYSSMPQQYAVLVLDAHNHVSRRVVLDVDATPLPSLLQVAVSPLGDAFAVSYAVQGYGDISMTPAISAVQKFDVNGQRVGAPYLVDLGSAASLSLSMNALGEVGIAVSTPWNAALKPAYCGARGTVGCIAIARLTASGAASLAPTVVETTRPAGVQNGGSVGDNFNSGVDVVLKDDGGFYLAANYVTDNPFITSPTPGNYQFLANYSATGIRISSKLQPLASSNYDGNQTRLIDYRPQVRLDAAGHPLFTWADGLVDYYAPAEAYLQSISVAHWINGVSGVPTTYPDLITRAVYSAGFLVSGGADAYGRSLIGWLNPDGLYGRCTQALAGNYRAQRLGADGSRQGPVLNIDADVPPDFLGRRCVVRPVLAVDADGDFAVLTEVEGGEQLPLGDPQIIARYAGPEPVDLALGVLQSGFGQKASYRYTVKNMHAKAAPTGIKSVDSAVGAATGLSLTLNLAGGDYRGYSGSGWTCSSADGLAVRCEYAPVLAATASSSPLTISAHIACRGTLQTTGRASSNQYDPTAGNDAKTSSKKAPAFGACN